MPDMNLLYTTPDESFGTIAECNGSLVHVDSGLSSAMNEIKDSNMPLYPSIKFESVAAAIPDFVGVSTRTSNPMENAYNDIKLAVKQQWEESRPTIEATAVYKHGKQIYDYIYSTPSTTIDHDIFEEKAGSKSFFKSITWHPHLEILAVAHRDDQVYVYEKKDLVWTCLVLSHPKMKKISCIEWKARTSGTLAVACKEGVCVWTLERVPAEQQPRFHPAATMKYFEHPCQDYVNTLAWDPTPGSYQLAAASSVSNTLVIYDVLLNRAVPLKRYNKGNVILRWSPNGQWLFEGGSSGTSRLWDTRDWTSRVIKNPTGLWVQAACWSPDNRTLIYSMRGKSDIHVLFLTGDAVKFSLVNVKVLSTPQTTATSESGLKIRVGGNIRDMTIDNRNGQRLAVAYDDSNLIALYSLKHVSPLNLIEEPMLFPVGYIRGSSVFFNPLYEVSALESGAKPLHVSFSSVFKDGALLATAWDNGIITFVTHAFLTDEEIKKRFM